LGFTEKLPTGTYRARWFDPAGKQRSKSFARERDAVRFLRNVESDIDRGTYIDDKAARITFGRMGRAPHGSRRQAPCAHHGRP
jgi:hypothetical protein